MTLPASGTIAMSQVNTELGYGSTATRSLNDSIVRTLFAKPSGAISLNDGHGKSNITYATWNPSDCSGNVALSNGNLTATVNGRGTVRATLGKSSGKWYWEQTLHTNLYSTGETYVVGVDKPYAALADYPGFDLYDGTYGMLSYGYTSPGYKGSNRSFTSVFVAYGSVGDVVRYMLDMDSKQLSIAVNSGGTTMLFGSLDVSTGYGVFHPAAGGPSGSAGMSSTFNFGASSFVYGPPSGYNAGVFV